MPSQKPLNHFISTSEKTLITNPEGLGLKGKEGNRSMRATELMQPSAEASISGEADAKVQFPSCSSSYTLKTGVRFSAGPLESGFCSSGCESSADASSSFVSI